MIKGIKSPFAFLGSLSIKSKFGMIMGGFMALLFVTINTTFWTANQQKGDARVINIAGRQRMLSQKMTKEAMALVQGKVKKAEVLATAALFDESLDDLISGNSAKGIPPTTDPQIKLQLGKVHAIWAKFNENLNKLIEIEEERSKVHENIMKSNTPLLENMNDAVFMMEQEKLDARTINLAGRQRMLSQKITKEALSLEEGGSSAEQLQETMDLFDKTLKGLISGSSGLGLKAMKVPSILSQLRKVEGRWKTFKSDTARLIELSGPSKTYTDYLLTDNITLLTEMNRAVGQYENISTAKVDTLKVIQSVLLVITAILFAIGWLFVSNPIIRSFTIVADELSGHSKDIAGVTGELSEGAKAQTGIVQSATKDLEEMIINIIQGNITLSVEKQSQISKAFSDFIKHFVERTSAEIAMGMMSVSHQSQEARKSMEDFVTELGSVESNIRAQEKAIEGIVEALKSIVDTNTEIQTKTKGSAEAADIATSKAFSGQERIESISSQLQQIRNSSEGVKEITESLAAITESIKILALNMSLKVEDIKDDTGKSYGFEAMSTKVQQLAEEVEGLLGRSRDMIIPTIDGIANVTTEASQTKDMIAEVTSAIKKADDESKAITEKIVKQAADVDRVEVEAENLRALAHKTTEAIEAQGGLVRDVDDLLKDSEVLITSVTNQTNESTDSARKINDMMEQLKATVTSIEMGTGKLTEKSSQIMDVFDSIRKLAEKNRNGAEKLDIVISSVRGASEDVSKVVKGTSLGKHSAE